MKNSILFWHFLIFILVMKSVLLSAIYLLSYFEFDSQVIASFCTGLAVSAGGFAAYKGFALKKDVSDEQWFFVFRDLHKDFWQESDLKLVRSWITFDSLYKSCFLRALNEKKQDEVSEKTVETIELFDRFCALMIRVYTSPHTRQMPNHISDCHRLGYDWWLQKIYNERPEMKEYIIENWVRLDKIFRKSLKNTDN